MPRQSTIRKLDPEIRDLIGRLRDSGRTIAQIRAKLEELDVKVSNGTMGRWMQQLDKTGERLRRSREVAEALSAKIGEAPERRQAQLNVELMHTAIMDLFMVDPDSDEPVKFDPKDVMFLSSALSSLASAAKSDTDLILKLRREVAAESAKAMESAAKKRGLSADLIKSLRNDILGIAQAPPDKP